MQLANSQTEAADDVGICGCVFRSVDGRVEDQYRCGSFFRVEIDVADKPVLVAAVAQVRRADRRVEKEYEADVGGETLVAISVNVRFDLWLPHFFQRRTL